MINQLFIGRKEELIRLGSLLRKKTASLVVIKGRRRIGKSRLIEEFIQEKNFYSFTGLPPTKYTTAQSQRNEFANQLNQQGFPKVKATDWTDLFWLLADKIKTGRVIVLLDEISWMGAKDPDFLGKLKNAWDIHFNKNPNLILILCGSVSSWIEKNILSSAGFFGRIPLKITLEELSLPECSIFLNKLKFQGSIFEKLILLSIMGGIPWYLEQLDCKLNAEENIKKLCFAKDGLLTDEFKYIFNDLFGKRKIICRRIVEYLTNGPAEYQKIATSLHYPRSGALSEYLNDLTTSGFISHDFSWALKSGKDSRLAQYRLKDNYLRFYLKYIAPNLNRINKGQFNKIAMSALPGWNSIMGLQFENLVLNNRALIHQALVISPEIIIADNPYIQHKTSKQQGVQIDYLIQTKYHNLYVIEIKFSHNEIGPKVIEEMQKKISALSLPRRTACLPVLIHVGGVADSVKESDYFYKIIDFGALL